MDRKFTCPHCRDTLLLMLDSVRDDRIKLKEMQRKYLMLVRNGDWNVESRSTVYCRIYFKNGICCYHLGKREREQFFRTTSKIKTEYFKLKNVYSCEETLVILSQKHGKSISNIRSLIFRSS